MQQHIDQILDAIIVFYATYPTQLLLLHYYEVTLIVFASRLTFGTIEGDKANNWWRWHIRWYINYKECRVWPWCDYKHQQIFRSNNCLKRKPFKPSQLLVAILLHSLRPIEPWIFNSTITTNFSWMSKIQMKWTFRTIEVVLLAG